MYCRDHSLKQGRRSHSFGIRLRSVLCIRAIRLHVDSKISYFTPRSVSRYSMVSCLSHCVHFFVSISRILCSLTFVGITSWISMYHADSAPSGNIALWRLPQTCDQSMAGWSCTMRISRAFVSAVESVSKVSYTLRLKDLPLGFHIRPFVKINE